MSNLVFPSSLPGLSINVSRSGDAGVIVQRATNGKEIRSSWQGSPNYEYSVAFEFLRSAAAYAELQALASFWARHFGALDSFLLTDPDDCSVSSMGFGVGDGSKTAFQLQRTLGGSVYDTLGGPWVTRTKARTNWTPSDLSGGSWGPAAAYLLTRTMPAPDGTLTAAAFVENTGATQTHRLDTGFASLTRQNAYVCVSAYVKALRGQRGIMLQTNSLLPDYPQTMFFADVGGVFSVGGPGGAGPALSCGVQSVGGGWYRVWQTTSTKAGPNAYVNSSMYLLGPGNNPTYTGDGASGVQLWGAQVEAVDSATSGPTSVLWNTFAPVTVNPAYWPSIGDGFEPVYDPAPGATLYLDSDGLGLRPVAPWARTNPIGANAIDFSTTWILTALTVAANATTAPDGSATADKLNEDATSNYHYAKWQPTLTPGLWTMSCYLKAGERTQAWINVGGTTAGEGWAIFDLTTGALVSSGGTAYVMSGAVPCGSGWWRLWITVQAGSTATGFANVGPGLSGSRIYAGTAGSGVYAWGAQVESGDTAYDLIDAAPARTDYTLSSTGGVTFATAPRSGAQLTWTGNYYKRVRFADSLSIDRIVDTIWKTKQIELIGVKP